MSTHPPIEKKLPIGSAFTLVELLVVIAILGMLAALLLPVLRSALESARQAKCAAQQGQVACAMISYQNDNNDTFFAWTTRGLPSAGFPGDYYGWSSGHTDVGSGHLVAPGWTYHNAWQEAYLPYLGRTADDPRWIQPLLDPSAQGQGAYYPPSTPYVPVRDMYAQYTGRQNAFNDHAMFLENFQAASPPLYYTWSAHRGHPRPATAALLGCAQSMLFYSQWYGECIGWGGAAHRSPRSWTLHANYAGESHLIPVWYLLEYRGRNQAYMDGHVTWWDTGIMSTGDFIAFGKSAAPMILRP